MKAKRKAHRKAGFKLVRLHENLKKGTVVKVHGMKMPKGKGLSYPAGTVKLLDDAMQGGWDVYDVLTPHGESSVYGFSIVEKKSYR